MNINLTGSMVLIVALTTCIANAAILRVPSEYATIQEAVDACVDGDAVLVASGTYTGDGNRDIDFLGKALLIQGENGAENCLLDCIDDDGLPSKGFILHNGEEYDSIISDITICHASVAIDCILSKSTLQRCHIKDCNDNSIVCVEGSNLWIEDCLIEDVIVSQDSNLQIYDCNIYDGIEGTGGRYDIRNCRFEGQLDLWYPTVYEYNATGRRATLPATDGLALTECEKIDIEDCTFKRVCNDILCSGSAVSINRCRVDDSPARMVCEGDFVSVSQCDIHNSSGMGFAKENCFYDPRYCKGAGEIQIFDCLIENAYGSGMSFKKCEPTIEDCVILNCSESGIFMQFCPQSRIKSCLIKDNEGAVTTFRAGGIQCGYGEIDINQCIISGNKNGGIGLSSCVSSSIVNSIISGNYGQNSWGAGIYVYKSEILIKNCTVTDNRFQYRGGIVVEETQQVSLVNSILWDNSSWQINAVWKGGLDVNYSNIQYGWEGDGILDQDPCFVDPGYWDSNDTPNDPNDDFFVMGDYHLKSQAGHWESNSEFWIYDDVTSPCIDAGDPNSPIMYEPFPNGGVVNMGAYGGTAEASKSYFGEPVCETIIAGDINGDGKVNLDDLAILIRHWTEED